MGWAMRCSLFAAPAVSAECAERAGRAESAALKHAADVFAGGNVAADDLDPLATCWAPSPQLPLVQ